MNHSTFLLRLIYVNFFFELESCNDGRKNQNETGIDCGGPCNDCGKLECALTLFGFCENQNILVLNLPCSSSVFKPESCDDGKKNQDESDVDCGGPCKSCGMLENIDWSYLMFFISNNFDIT